jgi:predicted unusual protein kinase regulating ubiquinone biosynthesis (AarF/ABC1/UbiB family)
MRTMLRSRYFRILRFFGGVILSIIWWNLILPRLGLRWLSARNQARRFKRIAVDFRSLAIRMGGVMIKVGQFLSARLDVLPREITDELTGLQDEVRPETFADIRGVVESEFNMALGEHYAFFEEHPMASASIGQVHRARLHDKDGVEQPGVVVKVQRPHIEEIVGVDLAALRVVSRWVDRYPPVRKRVSVPALMEEFSASLMEEIDYLQEGKNAEIFAENFKNDPRVNVPKVFWGHTTRRVLTLQDVQAIKISDGAALDAAGLDRKQVAARLFGTYLKQIFEDRFFHADPHPGNLFILPQPESGAGEWNLVFVDFGMVGRLPETLLSGLREALIALGTQDAGRLVRSYQQLRVLLPGADIEAIEKASAAAFSRFWGRTAPELAGMGRQEIAAFAEEFGEVLYEMPFQIPENFILLGRCVSILSGICSGLDPDFNIWNQIAPYAQKLVESDRGGPMEFVVRELTDTLRVVVGLPRRSESLLNRLEQGRLMVQTPDLKIQAGRLELALRRLTAALVFAAVFIGAVQLFLAGAVQLAGLAGGGALIVFLWMILMR